MKNDTAAPYGAENGVFRNKPSQFTQVPNTVINSQNLSLGAKGLYTVIQRHITIPGFKLTKWGLRKKCNETKYMFDKFWKELKNNGFLLTYSQNTRKGFFWYYELLDSPCIEIPCMGYPCMGSPSMGIRSIVNNTNKNNTDKNKNKNNKDDDIDADLLASKLENIVNHYRKLASESDLDPVEIEQSLNTFIEATCSITDKDIINSINESPALPICDLWKNVYYELFDTSLYGHPERSVKNKTCYTAKIIENAFRSKAIKK